MSDDLKKKYIRIAATLAMAIYEEPKGLSNVSGSSDSEYDISRHAHLADWKVKPHPWMNPVPENIPDTCTFSTLYSLFLFPQERTLFVVFRGTDNPSNVITDLTFWQCELKWNDDMTGVLVHKGFSDEYGLLRSCLQEDIINCIKQFPDVVNISFCGHSLGGAIAYLAALDASISETFRTCCAGSLCCSLYTFGAPAVGNNKYCELFSRVLLGTQNLFVNTVDIVPRSLDMSSTISNKIDHICKQCSGIGGPLLLVPEPYRHTSVPVALDGMLKVSADAAKMLLSNSNMIRGIPAYILDAHKMTTYVANLELSLRGHSQLIDVNSSQLVQSVVDWTSKALPNSSFPSALASSVSQATGISLLTCAVTNYHIHRVHQSLNMQLTKMEESINSHTAVNADRVIGEVNSAIQKFTEEQNNELIFVWNDGVDKTLRQMDLLNSSLQHHINQVAVTSLENDFKVNVKNCELRIDKLLRSYELYLHGQPIVWELNFHK